MPIFALTDELIFPPPQHADESGIIAVGGDLRAERLLLAYSQGIFPWPHEGYPLLWFCPKERFVVRPEEVHIGRTLQKLMRKSGYEVTFDTKFSEVIKECQVSSREGQNSTWITDDMIQGYSNLHQQGLAHSVEVLKDGALAGGLYGISLGSTFFGESMFSKHSQASKIAFATLAAHLVLWDFDLIDCQAETEHLSRFGAKEMLRTDFLRVLNTSVSRPTRRGKWTCSLSTLGALEYL